MMGFWHLCPPCLFVHRLPWGKAASKAGVSQVDDSKEQLSRDTSIIVMCVSLIEGSRVTWGLQGLVGHCPGVWAVMIAVLARFPSEDSCKAVRGEWDLRSEVMGA